MANVSLRLVTVRSRMAWKRGLIGIAGLILSAGVTNAQTTGQGYVVAVLACTRVVTAQDLSFNSAEAAKP